MTDKAVVLVSGGLDSATCLAIAKAEGFQSYALSFDYGQQHCTELQAAKRVCHSLGVAEHRVMSLDLKSLGGSALTDESIAVPDEPSDEIPVTYVPGRNTLFLASALSWAEIVGARHIFIGANAVDYSGYPDCREEYLEAFERMANLGTKAGVEGDYFHVRAPLVRMTKAQIIQKGIELGVDYSLTVSCYNADEQGRACGYCDSCRFRLTGFQNAGIEDPTSYLFKPATVND
jgi:7-cyano-7-deazaguanine synthase